MTTAAANGTIVPFSILPACASLCGPLFDVQGACAPPKLSVIDDQCFCSDSRLTPFDDSGTAGVASVCGSASCSATADLQSIKTWYDTFCAANKDNTGSATTTTSAGGTASTGGSSSGSSSSSSSHSAGTTWLDGHWKWVIMLVVLFVVIVGGWILACLFRRRYLRKKEKEIEMRPPVAWGPHQMQQATGGYGYGDGVVDANRAGPGGHYKEAQEAKLESGPVDSSRGKRLSKGWLGRR